MIDITARCDEIRSDSMPLFEGWGRWNYLLVNSQKRTPYEGTCGGKESHFEAPAFTVLSGRRAREILCNRLLECSLSLAARTSA
jgi:hypothetical protein